MRRPHRWRVRADTSLRSGACKPCARARQPLQKRASGPGGTPVTRRNKPGGAAVRDEARRDVTGCGGAAPRSCCSGRTCGCSQLLVAAKGRTLFRKSNVSEQGARAHVCLLDSIEVELRPLREVPVAPHRSSPRRRARARLSVCVTKSRFPAARFLSHESNTRRARPMEARGTTSLACCSVSCYVTPALAQSTVHAIGSFAGERLTAPAAAPRARSSRPSRRAFRRAVWPTRRANARSVSLQRASGGNRCENRFRVVGARQVSH